MKKLIAGAVVAVLGTLSLRIASFAAEVSWENIGREIACVNSGLVSPDNLKVIYLGSGEGVFKSEDAGGSWRNILSVKGENRQVNFLASGAQDKNAFYAATGNGLFYSANQGKFWKRIFKGRDAAENACTTLAILPYGIYLGTKGGLFVSSDNGRSWRREAGKIGKSPVLAIAAHSQNAAEIYLACADGVFKAQNRQDAWERIFVTSASEDGQDNAMQEKTDDADEEERYSDIRYIALDPQDNGAVYLASTKGIYRSRDKGKQWEPLSSYGLLSRQVKFLLVSEKGNVYLAAKSGIFVYTQERWQEISFGLAAGEVNSLALDREGNLYAACERGLFKAVINSSYADNAKPAQVSSDDEPRIKDVQQAAIKYAEVEPEKIKRWRRQAAKRALLPHLTVSMDRDNNRTASSSIWGIYGSNGSPGKYFVGPDDETKYNNNNWSISVTWELGDLIYSDDQTNIDVRSKLMVQLREDILDEVTKLYFERLRLKMELDELSITDRKKRQEKELKIEELTASLDGFTGGYFSQQLANNKAAS